MLKKVKPGWIIAFGFLSIILLGSLLLKLPVCVKDGVQLSYVDALYTSTSAVCVTGLTVVDAGDTFTAAGQIILGLLIQVGGLGVTSVGAGIILVLGKKIDLKGRVILRESLNLNTGKGLVKFLKRILHITLVIELAGAILSFLVFSQHFPMKRAIGISIFHSVAAFNNSGFDIFGGFQNMIPYQKDILLNLLTCALIFLGGIGYLVIQDVLNNHFHFRKLSFHSKVAILVSAALIVAGTLLLKLTEQITWLGALFQSVSARTAGFSSYPISGFSNAGILVLLVLMFIGASPGSTGGGIKTTTFFVLIQNITSVSRRNLTVFHYKIARENVIKACALVFLAMGVVLTGTFALLVVEPSLSIRDVLFEITSAFGTVGLSTGITPHLKDISKIITVLVMYIGRLGPLTIASLCHFDKEENVFYPEGEISIG